MTSQDDIRACIEIHAYGKKGQGIYSPESLEAMFYPLLSKLPNIDHIEHCEGNLQIEDSSRHVRYRLDFGVCSFENGMLFLQV